MHIHYKTNYVSMPIYAINSDFHGCKSDDFQMKNCYFLFNFRSKHSKQRMWVLIRQVSTIYVKEQIIE